MKVERIKEIETDVFMIGDVLKFKLTDDEKVWAMAVQQEADGMLFCLVYCLDNDYPMNDEDTNEGGYEDSDLRKKLNTEIIARFPADIKAAMVPFGNGDYLRIPTEKEVFGVNWYGDDEDTHVRHWKVMGPRRNRVALNYNEGYCDWYWLQNKCKDFSDKFAGVDENGSDDYAEASCSLGVRPVFKLGNIKRAT